jgi:GNAT superfamily N-acetyltransferase
MEITLIGNKNKEAFRYLMSREHYYELLGNKTVSGLGAVEDGLACAALVYTVEDQNARILSLYVDIDYRNKGFATELMDYFIAMCEAEEGVSGLSTLFAEREGAVSLRNFLEKYEFEFENLEMAGYECKLWDLKDIVYFKEAQLINPSSSLKYFETIPPYQLKQFFQEMTQNGENIIDAELACNCIDNHISVGYLKDDKLTGCITFMREENKLTLLWAYLSPETSLHFIPMLQLAVRSAFEICPPDTVFYVSAVNETSMQLLQKILGDTARKTEQLVEAVLAIA